MAEDFETGKIVYIDSSDRHSRRLYREQREKSYSDSIETFKKSDIDCIELSTTDDVADALVKYFRYRERKFR